MSNTKTNSETFHISKDQAKDTGMAMVLILLICGFIFDNLLYFKIAIPILIVNMTIPMIYKPVAFIWLKFSHLLGTFVSKILLSIIFFLVVTPIGLIRRMLGFDSLKLKRFKQSSTTAFEHRNYNFTKSDIEKPF